MSFVALNKQLFIPVLEHSNLIVEIGEWVMREVSQQARRWQDQGLNLKVSFNVSARQIRPISRTPAFVGALQTPRETLIYLSFRHTPESSVLIKRGFRKSGNDKIE